VATNLDARDASIHDLKIISPLILAVVMGVLVVLLRALVAPVVLILTVILSFFAALGAGSLVFRHVLDYPALDYQVPLFCFLFLVALGVDYNIFLVSRTKEETAAYGTHEGINRPGRHRRGDHQRRHPARCRFHCPRGAPGDRTDEIGIIVGLGVLLDTLLVRTVLVPALVHVLGNRFWAPGPLSRPRPRHAASEAAAPEAVSS